MIKQKNYVFILTFEEFIKAPFASMISNLRGMIPMFVGYITPTIFMLLVAGLIWGIIKKDTKSAYLFLWFLFPFSALAISGRVIFPRYLLFMTIPLFIICANALTQISKKMNPKVFATVGFLILAYPLYQTILLSVRPAYADIPRTDRNQLFDDWPSGYGVRETIEFLSEKSKEGKVVIGTEGTFGLFPAAYEIYLQENPNVEIHGYWPLSQAKAPLIELASRYPTYFVLKDTPHIPADWPVTLVRAYRRGTSDTYLYFFKVHPK